MWPEASMRCEYSPNGTRRRPTWTLNQLFGAKSRYMCSSSMPWQLAHAFAENERSSWMSTPILSDASQVTLRGDRAAISLSWMPQ